MSQAYHHPIGIRPDDIDHMGHVNNSVYLKWVQEAVIRYWESLAPPDAVARHLWVALKHEISYHRPTFVDDIVVADVIAEKVERQGPPLSSHQAAVLLAEVKHLVLPRCVLAEAGAAGARHRRPLPFAGIKRHVGQNGAACRLPPVG
jgi:hypothetical protein